VLNFVAFSFGQGVIVPVHAVKAHRWKNRHGCILRKPGTRWKWVDPYVQEKVNTR